MKSSQRKMAHTKSAVLTERGSSKLSVDMKFKESDTKLQKNSSNRAPAGTLDNLIEYKSMDKADTKRRHSSSNSGRKTPVHPTSTILHEAPDPFSPVPYRSVPELDLSFLPENEKLTKGLFHCKPRAMSAKYRSRPPLKM